jgi:hypothetical protein
VSECGVVCSVSGVSVKKGEGKRERESKGLGYTIQGL